MTQDTMKQTLNKLTAQLRQDFLYMLYYNIPLPHDTVEQVNKAFQFYFTEGIHYIFILSPTPKPSGGTIQYSWLVGAKAYISEFLQDFCSDFEILIIRNRIVCIASTRESAQTISVRASTLLSYLQSKDDMCDCHWTMGLGRCVTDFSRLFESHFSAQHALKYSVVHGIGKFYDGNQQNTIYEGGLTLATAAQKISIQKTIQKLDPELLKQLVCSIFESHRAEIQDYPVYAYMLALQIIQVAMQALRENMPVDRKTYELEQTYESGVEDQLSLEALMNHVADGLIALSQRYRLFLENGRSRPVWLVISYIEEHYSEKITLDDLAKCADRNPQYISAVFSRECGMCISEYITSLRIEKAKQLLCSSATPICDIAQQTGYQDPRYFSRIFQKETGLSPRNYRQQYNRA